MSKQDLLLNPTLNSIASRRSTRRFLPEAIDRSYLDKIIEMACLAPSPLNNQPWKFIIVEKKELIFQIAAAVEEKINSVESNVHSYMLDDYKQYRRNATFFKDAGVLIIVLLKPMDSDAKGHLWGIPGFFSNERKARGDIMCIGAACQNIMIAAESLDLASCLMLYPLIANKEVCELFDIRSPWEVMAYIPIGHSEKRSSKPPKRRDKSRIVQYF